MFYGSEKIALFVDGPSIWFTGKNCGFDIDYMALRSLFGKKSKLVRSFYYTMIPDTEEFTSLKPLIDYLSYNGWSVIAKPQKKVFDKEGETVRSKGSILVEMATDVMAMSSQVDHVVLCTGSADFGYMVDALHRRACRVTLVSSIKGAQVSCDDALRRAADDFVDILDIRADIERKKISNG